MERREDQRPRACVCVCGCRPLHPSCVRPLETKQPPTLRAPFLHALAAACRAGPGLPASGDGCNQPFVSSQVCRVPPQGPTLFF